MIANSLYSKRPRIDIRPGLIGENGEVRYNVSIAGKPHDVYFRSKDLPLYTGVEPLLVVVRFTAYAINKFIKIMSQDGKLFLTCKMDFLTFQHAKKILLKVQLL